MTYDRTERIRRAAILVASLEEPLAEALLRDLPPLEAAKVFAELDRLESIDPEEQSDVLEEFRRATRRSGGEEGAVEFTYSAPTAGERHAAAPTTESSNSSATGDGGEADAATMAELLSHEHPQIIAAALSRLGAERGAAVFAALPAELQTETLERLARLAPADEEAVLEVESLLLQQVDQRREHRERAAAGVELARQILARTAPERRAVLMARLPADGLLRTPTLSLHRESAAPVAQQAVHLASAIDRQRFDERFGERFDAGARVAWLADDTPADESLANLEDLSAELMALSDATLVAALRTADEQVVQRALAASGERLLDRVARMLPRRQARKLRRLVQSFGPASLAELRQAQHELLRVAREQPRVAA